MSENHANTFVLILGAVLLAGCGAPVTTPVPPDDEGIPPTRTPNGISTGTVD